MAEKKKGKEKLPTAIKRDIQSNKKRLLNRSFKSKVHTAVREFESALTSNEVSLKEKLSNVCSLLDKGVKKGIFKLNQASRTKSRFTAKVNAKA